MRGIIKLVYITLFFMIIVFFIGCNNIKNIEDSNRGFIVNKSNNKNLDFILATKKNYDNKLDLYFNEKEGFKKVLENVDANSFSYIKSLDEFVAKSENDIVVVKDGEINKLASDVESFNVECAALGCVVTTVPYKISGDESTIVYTTKDGKLYIKKLANGPKLITNDIEIFEGKVYKNSYKLSNDGNYVYYLTGDNRLYVVNSKLERFEIAENIYNYEISDNGRFVYYTKEDKYIEGFDVEKAVVIKINDSSIDMGGIKKVFDNGNLFITKAIYEMEWEVDLYYYNDEEKELFKVGTKVKENIYNENNYVIEDNNFYYIGEDNKLFKRVAKEGVEELAKDVAAFRVAEGDIYYINIDSGDLYIITKDKEIKKIGSNSNEMGWNFKIEKIDNKVGILTDNKELYINREKIEDEVEMFTYYKGNIVYYKSNNEVYSINLENKNKELKIENIKEYTNVYYGDKVLYDEERDRVELMAN